MSDKKTGLPFVKFIVLIVIIILGISCVYAGFQLSQKEPPPESPISFRAELVPKRGGPVGAVIIKLEPTEAFVIGDNIIADIEVGVYELSINERPNIFVRFIDCLSLQVQTDSEEGWRDIYHYNNIVILENTTYSALHTVYKGKAAVLYTHEGIFGVNVTVYSQYTQKLLAEFGTLYRTCDWSFPEIVHIKPYSYLEEKRSAQFSRALAIEVLGLAIITVSPVAVQAIDLFVESWGTFRKNGSILWERIRKKFRLKKEPIPPEELISTAKT